MLGPQIGPVCLGNVKLVVCFVSPRELLLPYFDKALDREGVKDKGITGTTVSLASGQGHHAAPRVRQHSPSRGTRFIKLKTLTGSPFASLRTSSTQRHKYCQVVYENLLKMWYGWVPCVPRSTILFGRELIGLGNSQNVYLPAPQGLVLVLMGSITSEDNPLSTTGSIVGIITLLISFSTIIQALVTYFAAYSDAPAELNRFTSSISNTIDENSHRLRTSHIPGLISLDIGNGGYTEGRWAEMLQEYYNAHLELDEELSKIKRESDKDNSLFN